MYGRTGGLDRFKKAQSSEPFSVTTNNNNNKNNSAAARSIITNNYSSNYQAATVNNNTQQQHQHQQQLKSPPAVVDVASSSVAAVGGGQSSWQPPDWAIEPRPGMYYLEVLKEGLVLDRINLDRRRHIFGRQLQTCDFVLDHTSVSRQHAAVVPHKNGSIYVIDLGSAHGTFVANERLTKNSPVELEAGQSLRFAASTRTYILRKNEAALFPPPPLSPSQIKLPPPPDPSNEDAILTYNTFLNRYGLLPKSNKRTNTISADSAVPTKKRARKMKVGFRDQVGGDLIEVVGFSDGADVETEPGPVGVKEGSLVGKYASLVQTTVIPKGKEETSSSAAAAAKETNINNSSAIKKGVTDKLQQILDKVKNAPPRSGMYEDLYGDSFSGKVGSSWAATDVSEAAGGGALIGKLGDNNNNSSSTVTYDDDDDDLFGD